MVRKNCNKPGRVDLAVVPASGGEVTSCPVYVGTCGYSYLEWVDSGFYPQATKTSDMLALYSSCFSVVELNYTWYQMARADALQRMMDNSPQHLLFAAKLTRTMTHERDESWREQLRRYREGIHVLGNRLVAVLVQLPPDFDRSVANRTYLAVLLDGLEGLPVGVEFRHRSWAVDSVFEELRRREVTLVAVDEPELPGLFPSLDVVTNPKLFYARLHGRNCDGWRSGNMQKKFNYDYSEEELRAWCTSYLLPMAMQSERGIVLFNNHVRAQAPRNGRRLLEILKERDGTKG